MTDTRTDFGPVGLAAALHSTPEEILSLVHAGVIRPDHVIGKEPRWRAENLAEIFKQLLPGGSADDALDRSRLALEALLRAEAAELGGGA